MSDEDESVVRAAYEAYGQGEVNRLLELVHPDLEWTYLDPSVDDGGGPHAGCRSAPRMAIRRPQLPGVDDGLRTDRRFA